MYGLPFMGGRVMEGVPSVEIIGGVIDMRRLAIFWILVLGVVSCGGGGSTTSSQSGTNEDDGVSQPTISSGPSSTSGVILPGSQVNLTVSTSSAVAWAWCATSPDGSDAGYFVGEETNIANIPNDCKVNGVPGTYLSGGVAGTVSIWNAPLEAKTVNMRVWACANDCGSADLADSTRHAVTAPKPFTVDMNLLVNAIPATLQGTAQVSGTLEGHRAGLPATISLKVDGENLPSVSVGVLVATKLSQDALKDATLLCVADATGFGAGNRVRIRNSSQAGVSLIIKSTILSEPLCFGGAAIELETPLSVAISADSHADVWQLQPWTLSGWDTNTVPTAGDGSYSLDIVATDSASPPHTSLATETVTIKNDQSGGNALIMVTTPSANEVVAPAPDINPQVGEGRMVDFSAVVNASLSVNEVQFFVDLQFVCSDTDGTDGWSCSAESTWDPPNKQGLWNPIAGGVEVEAWAFLEGDQNPKKSDKVGVTLLNCGTLLGSDLTTPTSWDDSGSPYFFPTDLTISSDLTVDTLGGIVFLKAIDRQSEGFSPIGIDVRGSLNVTGGNLFVIEPVTVGTKVDGDDPSNPDRTTNGFCPGQPATPETASAGSFGQVKFSAGAEGSMENVWVRFGGALSDLVTPVREGGVIIESAGTTTNPLVFDGLTIEDVRGDGLTITGSPLTTQPLVDNLKVKNAESFALVMQPAYAGLGSTIEFIGNGFDAVQIESGSIPQAVGVVRWPPVTGSYVVDGVVTVEAGATLSFDPGTVVKFATAGSGLSASGTLQLGRCLPYNDPLMPGCSENVDGLDGIPGNADDPLPVVLTSFDDDTAGVFDFGTFTVDCGNPAQQGNAVCDTNNNGLSTGNAGSWGQVLFGIQAKGFLDNVEIRFAGSDNQDGAIKVQSASLRAGPDGTTGIGLDCDNPGAAIDDNDASPFSPTLKEDCVVIMNTVVREVGGYGVVVSGQPDTYPVIRSNVFTGMGNYPVLQIPGFTGFSDGQNDGDLSNDNQFCNYDFVNSQCQAPQAVDKLFGIRMLLGQVADNEEAVLQPMHRGDGPQTPMPYVLDQDISVEGDTDGNGVGGVFSIAPGVLAKLETTGGGITVAGTLCVGSIWNALTLACEDQLDTLSNPVVFTALSDDNFQNEGDTNGDGGNSTPSAGAWRRIDFTSDSRNSRMVGARVRFGGGDQGAAVLIDGTFVHFTDNTIEDSLAVGLEVQGTVAELIDPTKFAILGTSDLVRAGIKRNTFNRNGVGGGATPDSPPISIPLFSSLCGSNAPASGVAPFLEGCNGPDGAPLGGDDWMDQNIIPPAGNPDANGISGIRLHTQESGTIASSLLAPVRWAQICAGGAATCSITAGDVIPLVPEGRVIVEDGAELILENGLLVKFDGGQAGLDIFGSLTAAGNPDDPNNPNLDQANGATACLATMDCVVLTSLDDDTVSGDTNGDGASAGDDGYWRGVRFERVGTPLGCPSTYPVGHPGLVPLQGPCGRVLGVTIAFGGSGSKGATKGDLMNEGNLLFKGTDAVLVQGLRSAWSAENGMVFMIEESGSDIPGTFPMVSGSLFENNEAYPVAGHPSMGAEWLCQTVNPADIPTTMGRGPDGVLGTGDDCLANTFMVDSGAALGTQFPVIALHGPSVPEPNTGSNLCGFECSITDRVVGVDTTWTPFFIDTTGDGAPDTPMAYFIEGDVRVASGSRLAINQGTVIKMGDPTPFDDGLGNIVVDNTGVDLFVSGFLEGRGTDANPISWTSVADDCNGEIDQILFTCTITPIDSNRDLFSRGQQTGGDWGSLRIQTQISGLLEDVRVLFGGGGGQTDAAAISFTGPSDPGAVFRVGDADVGWSLGHGIAATQDFNLDVTFGTEIHHNGQRGIHASDSPFIIEGSSLPNLTTSIHDNGSDGLYIEFTQDPVVDGVTIQDNGGWGIYMLGGDADSGVGACDLRQPVPVIVSSNDINRVRRNGLGGVRFENIFDFTLDGAIINENGADGDGYDTGHGVDFLLDDGSLGDCIGSITPSRGEMLNNTVSQNSWRGLAARNEFVDPGGNFLTPRIISNTFQGNTGGGIYIKHTGPTFIGNQILDNDATVLLPVGQGGGGKPIPPGFSQIQIGHGLYVHLDQPDWGFPITPGTDPDLLVLGGADQNKHDATEPSISSSLFRDNSPYQARIPAGVELGDGASNQRPMSNIFDKTAADTVTCNSGATPCVRNAVQVYGWVIRDEDSNDATAPATDPDTALNYPANVNPDTVWGALDGSTGGVPFSGNVPYLLTNDLVVLPSDGFESYSALAGSLSPVYLQVDGAIVKVSDEPENPEWSQNDVDIHNHSLLIADDSFFTSIHDQTRGGKIDFHSPEFGIFDLPAAPGDWGAILFHSRTLDFWEGFLNIDTVCESDIVALLNSEGGTTDYTGSPPVPNSNENPQGCNSWTDHPNSPYNGTQADEDEECDPACDWKPNTPYSASGNNSLISRLGSTAVIYGGGALEGMVWMQQSSPLFVDVDISNSLTRGMYIDGNGVNPGFQPLTFCAGPFCSVPYGENGRYEATHPRAIVSTSGGNLQGDCLFTFGGGIGLVAGITCTQN